MGLSNLKQLEFSHLTRFIEVVEAGSLNKAADNLNLTQPGVSKSVRHLEAHFGQALLHRNSKGISPTSFGQAVYRRAKRVLAEWQHLYTERTEISGGLTGHVTVGVARGTGFLGRVMPAVCAKLSDLRYAVRLSVVSGVAEELVPALQLGQLDFAIAPLDAAAGKRDLVSEVLFLDRCGLFVDAQHALATSRSATIERLVKYSWAYSTDAAFYYDALGRLAHAKGVEPRRTVITSNSVIYLGSTLIGSEFVGILSMDSVEDHIIAGRLVEVMLQQAQRSHVPEIVMERPVGFLRRADMPLSEIALALQEEVYAVCPGLGYPLLPRRNAGKA
jgi:DNA-binding transcriptional LysR family regulator